MLIKDKRKNSERLTLVPCLIIAHKGKDEKQNIYIKPNNFIQSIFSCVSTYWLESECLPGVVAGRGPGLQSETRVVTCTGAIMMVRGAGRSSPAPPARDSTRGSAGRGAGAGHRARTSDRR